jgi:nitrate/nitrite transport system ATP-binding protein
MTSYLKIDHVDKSFHRGSRETEVLKDVSLSIESGEYVSIIGHSGCGKSTLLNIVAGLLPVTRGAVAHRLSERQARGGQGVLVDALARGAA